MPVRGPLWVKAVTLLPGLYRMRITCVIPASGGRKMDKNIVSMAGTGPSGDALARNDNNRNGTE